MRIAAFKSVGGFDASLIAGEEPELCFRLRERGHRIERIAAEMTIHDAALSRFSQWWRRALRAGHAYSENFALHGASPERFRARELRSIVAWGTALPLAAIALALTTRGVSLLAALGLYALLFLRVCTARRRSGTSLPDAAWYALFVVVGKWAQATGAAWYCWNRALGRHATLIEYKRSG